MTYAVILAFALTAAISFLGIEAFRRTSISRQWLDRPNPRSSHTDPTPRGAGIAIVAICVLAYILISYRFNGSPSWGYLSAVMLVSVVSWIDDRYGFSSGFRLLLHFAAAVFVVIDLGYWRSLGTPTGFAISLSWFGPILTIIWIVWVINAYNFMDGIDGIAGLQALVAAGAWSIVAFPSHPGLYLYSIVIAGSCFGFLLHNWNPARVFLGDVGSAFLGLTFATFPFMLATGPTTGSPLLPIAAALFIWPFIFDSVITRIFRLKRHGRDFWRPHKEHFYQKLGTAGYSHGFVAMVYGVFALASASAGLIILTRSDIVLLITLLIVAGLSLLFALVVSRVFYRSAASNAS